MLIRFDHGPKGSMNSGSLTGNNHAKAVLFLFLHIYPLWPAIDLN